MSAREMVINEALELLKRYCHENACREDVLLFGPNCGVASALPKKYGLDNIDLHIYNISKELQSSGHRIFGGVSLSGGYIDLVPSENGWALITDVFRAEHPDAGEVSYRFDVGCNAGYIHAAFLHTANTAAGGFLIPRDFWARRALWFCIMANTQKQRSMALEAAYKALEEHRRNNLFSAETAGLIASAVVDWI